MSRSKPFASIIAKALKHAFEQHIFKPFSSSNYYESISARISLCLLEGWRATEEEFHLCALPLLVASSILTWHFVLLLVVCVILYQSNQSKNEYKSSPPRLPAASGLTSKHLTCLFVCFCINEPNQKIKTSEKSFGALKGFGPTKYLEHFPVWIH